MIVKDRFKGSETHFTHKGIKYYVTSDGELFKHEKQYVKLEGRKELQEQDIYRLIETGEPKKLIAGVKNGCA